MTPEAANRFLREEYIAEFNQRFSVAASEHGTAFVPLRHKDLDLVFSIQHERVVARDNTVIRRATIANQPSRAGKFGHESNQLDPTERWFSRECHN